MPAKGDMVGYLKELGFDLVGVSRPEIARPRKEAFVDWLEAGRHADMRWLEREREIRLSPELFHPGCRSVIVVGLSYHKGRTAGPRPGAARIAGYARGWDYHTYVRGRLERFAAWVAKETPSFSYKISVDSSPVYEKALAVQAGLGWLGKNSLVINPKFGSWLVLGALFTDLPIEPDGPGGGSCGSCDACLRGCPAGALPEPYVLDAGRCFAYLTVENRKPIPDDVLTKMSPRAFGCDGCQEVCPVNKTASAGRLVGRRAADGISWSEFSSIPADEFSDKFAGTPVMRALKRGLRSSFARRCSDMLG
jgi:epoxyqueuosine reductase